jgi:hypothetical protein
MFVYNNICYIIDVYNNICYIIDVYVYVYSDNLHTIT